MGVAKKGEIPKNLTELYEACAKIKWDSKERLAMVSTYPKKYLYALYEQVIERCPFTRSSGEKSTISPGTIGSKLVPYSRFTKEMLVKLVYQATTLFMKDPPKTGVSAGEIVENEYGKWEMKKHEYYGRSWGPDISYEWEHC